ncbi:putative NAD dependent epimerase dehydratase family protein [Lyophyllum shimeji]|uniref:NAD dependent epimerase dehydratase family protein n=1 Tax=Lyophyllum shimeji TaxID=47721 RepID=A0A9P3UK87_LYOSH|nr:putative NAD dependent epimerase dehydratase family protein [Lyophyllum shimeji]
MPKVLVTGSSGHLGHALMLKLPSYGYQPIGIDILPSQSTTIVGSIADRVFLAKLFEEHQDITAVLHTATLHKPHIISHTNDEFVQTNVSGTLALLETAASKPGARCQAFIFTSTTSTFGRALAPRPGEPAAWIDESVVPVPKNIYGITKVAAEDLCELVHRQSGMPVVVLRTSRFFPEPDDADEVRAEWDDENLKVCELAYRRVDIADVVSAHVCALEKAGKGEVRWGRYVVSAPTPFVRCEELMRRLDGDAPAVMREVCPEYEEVFGRRGWRFLPRLDRVYDSSKAVRELGWKPEWTFGRAVEAVARGESWQSELTRQVGKKGYHEETTGVYTTR